MNRPHRYPYTKSQWVEESSIICGDDFRFRIKVVKNEITGERK